MNEPHNHFLHLILSPCFCYWFCFPILDIQGQSINQIERTNLWKGQKEKREIKWERESRERGRNEDKRERERGGWGE